MTQETRQPFTPTGKFIARREFRFEGRTFKPGESFPWRQLACSVRKLTALHNGRYINSLPLKEVPEPTVTPRGEKADEANQGGKGFTFHPTIHTIINPKHGEWYIASQRDEHRVLRITRKEAHRLGDLTESTVVREDQIVK